MGRGYAWWGVATAVCIGIDQGIKAWIAATSPYFALGRVSFAFYPNYDGPFQLRLSVWLLHALATILLIVVYLLFTREAHSFKKISLWLICVGGLSIAGERFVRGYVTDTFLVGTLAFNLADMAVTAGLLLYGGLCLVYASPALRQIKKTC
jgi:lipoprotein signal peptidase